MPYADHLTDGIIVWLEGEENKDPCLVLDRSVELEGYVILRQPAVGDCTILSRHKSLKEALIQYASHLPADA